VAGSLAGAELRTAYGVHRLRDRRRRCQTALEGAAAAGDADRGAMVELTDEQKRALRLLSAKSEWLHGGDHAGAMASRSRCWARLALVGFAKVEAHDTMAGSRRMKVVWMQITAAGRKAITY
jgi:hypothetical protein